MKNKKNLWPFAIIATFVVFISGTISLIVMACSQKQDLVSSDYYEQEIRFQSHLEQVGRAHRAQRPASIDYDIENKCIRISLLAEPGARVSGHIQLYRPSAAGLDRNFRLTLDSQGVQSVDTSSLSPGLWKVRVSWMADSQECFLEKSIVVNARRGPRTAPQKSADVI